jgi:hypothetical protein
MLAWFKHPDAPRRARLRSAVTAQGIFCMDEKAKPLLFQPAFLTCLGTFHGAWATAEMTVDYCIGHFLNIPHEQTHLLTSGMMFGRKSQLLAGLIARSTHANKSELLRALNVLRGDGKRDWLTHAYLLSNPDTVTFAHRNVSGEYKLKPIVFTLETFMAHVKTVTQAGEDLEKAIGLTHQQLTAFLEACANAENKAAASPQ